MRFELVGWWLMSASERPSAEEPQGHKHTRAEYARIGVSVLLAVLITLFAVFNLDSVKVDWIFGTSHAPLIIVIVVSFLVGVVLASIVGLWVRKRRTDASGARPEPG